MNIYLGAAGAINPLGETLETQFAAMLSGQSGIKRVNNAFDLGRDEYLGIIDDKILVNSESTKLRKMLVHSLDQSIMGGLKDPELAESDKLRLILCSTKGEVDQFESGNPGEVHLYRLSAFLKSKYRLSHDPLIISSACISGLLGIINAGRMIQSGMAEHVIVAGADLVTKFTLSGFISFYATADGVSKPYDRDRNGINLGEAAASVILSVDKSIFKEPLAKFMGGASANDANHISGPSRTGEGLYRSVKNALRYSAIQKESIDYISAHGTATTFNDEMESIAFDRLKMNDIPLNSFKGYFGHTLGAAGLLETLMGLKSMQQNVLLPSHGFQNPGVSKSLNILKENLHGNYIRMLKTASGFGGSNAAALFQLV